MVLYNKYLLLYLANISVSDVYSNSYAGRQKFDDFCLLSVKTFKAHTVKTGHLQRFDTYYDTETVVLYCFNT
jgi:hypothetical protein